MQDIDSNISRVLRLISSKADSSDITFLVTIGKDYRNIKLKGPQFIMSRVGVLLLNLGGPEKPEDVQPFLFNLFADPEIIRIPFPILQKPLAWFISSRRAEGSRANYEQIGGGSPLRRITEEQGTALKAALKDKGKEAEVYIGMRYWHPFTEEAIANIKRDGVDKLVVLPLYPQYSISTSGSSFRLLEQIWKNDSALTPIDYTLIESWYSRPGYVNSMADLIRTELDKLPDPNGAHIFFSAHGVPVSYVEEFGDPYQKEIQHCTDLIMQAVGRPNDFTLAYQSRVGPIEWLQPYTEDAIKSLAESGVKDLVVVPISFVSEHIETLQEIDIEYREIAEEEGIEGFHRVPALDTYPRFIADLADMVEEALTDKPVRFSDLAKPEKKIKIYPQDKSAWGMTPVAEVWNGRLAMLGFLALLAEIITGHGPLHLIGLL